MTTRVTLRIALKFPEGGKGYLGVRKSKLLNLPWYQVHVMELSVPQGLLTLRANTNKGTSCVEHSIWWWNLMLNVTFLLILLTSLWLCTNSASFLPLFKTWVSSPDEHCRSHHPLLSSLSAFPDPSPSMFQHPFIWDRVQVLEEGLTVWHGS